MLIVAPITSNLKASRFPFSILVEPTEENGLTLRSVVMVFQMRAVDKARIINKIGKLSYEDLLQVDSEMWKMLKP